MSFRVTHRFGNMEKVQHSTFADFLQQLEADPDDEEYASVGVTHESEWCFGVYRGKYAVLNRS